MLRYIIAGVVVLAIIPVVWLAWWLLAPLFSDTEVNEAPPFPHAANAVIPDEMTMEQVELLMSDAASEPDKLEVDAMPAMPAGQAGSVTARLAGDFRGADAFHRGSGTATIYEVADGEYTLRLDTFRVTNGPDLRVLLANAPDPEGYSDLNAAGYVELGRLKGNVGAQNYEIEAGFDLSRAQSVVIFCNPFRVIFSVAPLDRPP